MPSDNLKRILFSTVLMFGFAAWAAEPAAQTNSAAAAPRKSASPAAAQEQPGAEPKARPLPYKGKLASVDTQRSAIKVGTRVFHVGAKTKIEKAGKPATLEEGVTGEIVTGSYKKQPDGTLEAVSVYFGGKAAGSSSSQGKSGKTQTTKAKE